MRSVDTFPRDPWRRLGAAVIVSALAAGCGLGGGGSSAEPKTFTQAKFDPKTSSTRAPARATPTSR